MNAGSFKKYLAELLGVAMIVEGVLGAGYMVANLGAQGGVGLALIATSVGAILFVAISILGPISGAHLNPAVTLVMLANKSIGAKDGFYYIVSQLVGGFVGALVANLMYEKALVSVNETVRAGYGQYFGEFVATFGLVLIVLMLIHHSLGNLIAPAVGIWVLAGHFFTSSTSFANPAVTFGRAFSDALTGIEWASVPAFVLFEVAGGYAAYLLFKALTKK